MIINFVDKFFGVLWEFSKLYPQRPLAVVRGSTNSKMGSKGSPKCWFKLLRIKNTRKGGQQLSLLIKLSHLHTMTPSFKLEIGQAIWKRGE